MRQEMKYWLIIINNFAHDLFTGFWVSTIIVIYMLIKQVPVVHGIPAETFRDVTKVFFLLGVFSVIMIIITGIIRTLYYFSLSNISFAKVKRQALIIKHMLLGLIFIAGTYWAYSSAYH